MCPALAGPWMPSVPYIPKGNYQSNLIEIWMVLDRIQITEKHSSLNNTFTASHVGRVTPISPSVGTRGSAGPDLSPCHNGPVCPLVVLFFLLFKSTEIRENKKNRYCTQDKQTTKSIDFICTETSIRSLVVEKAICYCLERDSCI